MPNSSPKLSRAKQSSGTKRKSTTPRKRRDDSASQLANRLGLPTPTGVTAPVGAPKIGSATGQWLDSVIDRHLRKWLDAWGKRGVSKTLLDDLLVHLMTLPCPENLQQNPSTSKSNNKSILVTAAQQANKAEHFREHHPLIRLALATANDSRETDLRRGCRAAIQKIVGYQPNDRARKYDPSNDWLNLLEEFKPQLQHWWHHTPKTAKKSEGKAITLLAKALVGDGVGEKPAKRVGLLQVIRQTYSNGGTRLSNVEAQSRITADRNATPLKPRNSRAVLIASGELELAPEPKDRATRNAQTDVSTLKFDSLRSVRRDIKKLRSSQ
jgi:hypothetical protein